MRKSRTICSLEVATLTAILAWKVVTPIPAPATQLTADAKTAQNTASKEPELTAVDAQTAISNLRLKKLTFPIKGFDVQRVKSSYSKTRNNHPHEAIDIVAPRNTPILAVDDGTIAKLFLSKLGGTTIYQFDPTKNYVYYYAHLERYADGLKDNATIKKGQVIGFVGTSGDAPKDTPHLHFSITLPGAEKKWWQTAPVNPYLVFKP